MCSTPTITTTTPVAICDLKEKHRPAIVGPSADRDRIPGIDEAVDEGERLRIRPPQARSCSSPATPAATSPFGSEADKAVFCGDTLFAMGCGRLFEGTAPQMWSSLGKLRALPAATRVYCGHEYTQNNARFALTVEPGNAALKQRALQVDERRSRGVATIPSTIGEE